jgi:hypothetical protein
MLSLGKNISKPKEEQQNNLIGENISEPKQEQQKDLFGENISEPKEMRSFCCSSLGSLIFSPKEIILLFFFRLADVFPQ